MELVLTLERPGDPSAHAMRVEIDPSATCAELSAALEAALGLAPGDRRLWLRRTRLSPLPTETVTEARILQGDHLAIAEVDRPPAWAHLDPTTSPHNFELLVVGGPDAGERIPLESGTEYFMGRDPDNTIPLNDSQASRRHLHIGVGSERVAITDMQSTNGTNVDGRRIEGTRDLRPGQVVEVGTTLFTVEQVDPAAPTRHAQITYYDGHLAFNRPPRVSRPLPSIVIELPAAPVKPFRRKLPLSAAIVPVLMGVVLAQFVGPIMLLFCLMGPVMMAVSVWEDRRGGHKEFRAATARFEEAYSALDETVAARHEELIVARRASAPSAAHLLARARERRPDLWERRPNDTDFLTLRVGSSDLPTKLEFHQAYSEDPDEHMQARVDAVAAEHDTDPDVPVDVDLQGVGVLGIAGADRERDGLLRWLVVQAATIDSPRDLAIVVLAPKDDADRWAWTRWLPHTQTLFAGLSGTRSVAADPDDVRSLFQAVDDAVVQRRIEAERRLGFDDTLWLPRVLLVLPGELEIPRPSLSRLLAGGPEFGVNVIVGARFAEYLPGECKAIIQTGELGNDWSATVTSTGDSIPGIVGDGISLAAAEQCALDLAPISDVSAASAVGDVPRQCLLLDVLDLSDPDAEGVRQRWSAHAGGEGLGAPIGMGAAGRVEIDLRRDGPHGLTAGTTGAGKSELLQSYVAALAATYPPSKLTFVLVDYKGGAAFKDCVELPHTVGFFTDLDAHLAKRALVSLNAELRRREEILREHGAKDLIDLERKDAAEAPANLFIVFDEFAFLKKEVPEFVAGVIDIAQRGRSLGVHLMLATQRPSGVVDDHIRANTNLRIALRIADEADSNDVIDRPDAAHIPKSIPGRAYVRTGHADVQLVQSAYGGARSGGGAQKLPTRVSDFTFASGMRRGAGPAAADDDDERPTDLQRLVAAIRKATREAGIPSQPLPWLPPLLASYDLGDLAARFTPPHGATELCAPMGVVDAPDRQAQDQWSLDLGSAGHLLVYGTSGTGKTTALRTLAASFASRLWPTDLFIYGLDFATRGLRPVAELPHCGGIVNADEIEKAERLVAMLEQLVTDRKEVLGAAGAGSLVEYRASVGPVLPYVLVLLDGYAGFHSVFVNIDHGELLERVARLAGEGRSVGLHIVITADRRNAIPSTISGVVSERLVLRMADADEYATLGLPLSTADADLPPGRGFVEDGREVQLAVLCLAPGQAPASGPSGDGSPGVASEGASVDATGAGQASAMARFGASLREAAGASGVAVSVPAIELLPDHLSREVLDPVVPGRALVPIGMSGETYATSWLDFDDAPLFLVLGPDRSGRSSALLTIAQGLFGALDRADAYLLAPRRTPLAGLPFWTEVAQGVDACDELATRLADEVRQRAGTTSVPLLVMVDDGDELTEGRSSLALETIVRRGRDAGVVFVVASQTHVVHRTFGGWLTDVRKAKQGLFLAPDVEIDGELLGTRLPRKAGRSFPAGRAYVVRRGQVELVQLALP